MTPEKKGGKKPKGKAASKKQAKPEPPKTDEPTEVRPPEDDEQVEETGEFELGEDFLADLKDDEEELTDEELDALEDEEALDEEEELTEIVNAETEEWEGLEAAESEEDERTLVGAAGARIQQARSKVTSGFEAVGGERITEGFKALGRHIRFPLWARFLTASFVIVLSVGTATAASLILYLDDLGHRIGVDTAIGKQLAPDLSSVEGGEPQTIMILGSDKRPELKGDSFRGLSDTTMLLRVDPDRGAIALFSLPRDLRVEIPGYGTAKLNEAYAHGGPSLTLRTIKQLTGLDVNHVVNVDFEGFARAVNEIDCVYVDVDRRYFHSNEGLSAAATYEEIDLQPGYQALCGFDALDYARYRHTDNDVVRASRQQDFLREARQKVPPEVVFAQRKDLIDIFAQHTTSDIDTGSEMLEVLKLFIEARDAELKEVHFEGTLGPSFVTTTSAEIEKAVNQFLGIESTPGPAGESAAPEGPVVPEEAPDETGDTPATPDAPEKKKKKRDKGGGEDAQLIETDFGRDLARGIRQRRIDLPAYYPTKLEIGTEFAQKPRVYKINGTGRGSPPDGQRAAYKWVFSRPVLGEYYGFMATRWEDPPILENPSETREIGDREYKLYYDGDRLRMVAWQDDRGSFWVTNTLIQSLSDTEMIEIARGMTELPFRGG
jgi:LCP family protein required for cell wall assembly